LVPYQLQVLKHIRTGSYKSGPKKILLSGAVGSGKTIVVAHAVVTHCLMYPNALVGIGRLSLRYLKDTLLKAIIEQVGDIIDIKFNKSTSTITFPNGSQIMAFSWSDGSVRKFRSYQFTAFAIDELTESQTPEAYNEIFMRLGRRSDVDESWLLCASNPESPDHWVYKEFIGNPAPGSKVFYSKTRDNKLLPDSYESNLRATMDPLMARRMLEGEWLSIAENVIYYQFSDDNIIESYDPKPRAPIYISFDFNIGTGKPMSCCISQFVDGTAYYFDEIILEGMRTNDVLDEIEHRGYFSTSSPVYICADATGSSRDTRGVRSDLDIIKYRISNLDIPIPFRIMVPPKNPAIRLRHNIVNAYLKNANGDVRLKVSSNCSTIIDGLRHTKLKAGANFVEDDSYHAQHVTTSLGYSLFQKDLSTRKKSISQGRR